MATDISSPAVKKMFKDADEFGKNIERLLKNNPFTSVWRNAVSGMIEEINGIERLNPALLEKITLDVEKYRGKGYAWCSFGATDYRKKPVTLAAFRSDLLTAKTVMLDAVVALKKIGDAYVIYPADDAPADDAPADAGLLDDINAILNS